MNEMQEKWVLRALEEAAQAPNAHSSDSDFFWAFLGICAALFVLGLTVSLLAKWIEYKIARARSRNGSSIGFWDYLFQGAFLKGDILYERASRRNQRG